MKFWEVSSFSASSRAVGILVHDRQNANSHMLHSIDTSSDPIVMSHLGHELLLTLALLDVFPLVFGVDVDIKFAIFFVSKQFSEARRNPR